MAIGSYGDVTAEYLALKRGAGAVPDHRGVVWIDGPDAVAFLDGLVSQDVAAMADGDVSRALLLSPRGKLVAPLWLTPGEGRVGVITDVGVTAAVADALSRFKIRVDCDISIDPGPVVELWGPGAPAVLLALGVDPVDGWKSHGRGGIVARLPFRHGGPPRWLTTGLDIDALSAAGARPVGNLARSTLAIERGEPIMGIDVDESTIPAEADLVEGAVSFTKGCYLGQELVARIDSRGHVNRLGRGLVITDAVLPPAGAAVVVDDETIGAITSVGESLDLRAPIAYSMVRSAIEPGTGVRIVWDAGSIGAEVRAFPLEPDLAGSSG